uniref:Acyl-coenzyme A thioesterase 13 n=1 Tax=Crocodylus porosus TaxID=8502 RepID=A0A7M4E8D8_CROPO
RNHETMKLQQVDKSKQIFNIKCLSATPRKIVCEMKVEQDFITEHGTMHGGLTATLIDIVSTAALMNSEKGVLGVSVDMNITYISGAKLGEELQITAQILKQGKHMAFTSVDLTNKATKKLIAQGRHTKFMAY